jgi:transcriptional regulator with XRE-family HTH domain
VGQFGDKFRNMREKKGISLDDVSNVTKISSRMLQAIEQENFDQLPGGVFNRGFIRAYAKHLGLNDEEAVTDYLACLRQAQIDAQATWQPEDRTLDRPAPVQRAAYTKPSLNRPDLTKPAFTSSALKPEPTKPVLKKDPPAEAEELPELQLPRAQDVRPPRRDYAEKRSGIPWTILAAAAVVVVLVATLWIRRSRSEHAESGAQTANAPGAASPAPQSAPAPIATTTPQASSPPSNQNASSPLRLLASSNPRSAQPANATHPASPPPANPQSTGDENDVTVRTFPPANSGRPPSSITQPANAASSTSQPASTPSSSASTGAKSSTASSPNQSSSGPSSSNPFFSHPPSSNSSSSSPSSASRPLTLVIRATETSWISVTADGQPVNQETLIAPAHASIRASREIIARIGNAAGVSFLWNGQDIPAQGAEAEVKTYVFDAQGMHEAPNQPPAPNQ